MNYRLVSIDKRYNTSYSIQELCEVEESHCNYYITEIIIINIQNKDCSRFSCTKLT